jgi:hypothetical protein
MAVCDIACQREKQLSGLLTAFKRAEVTKDSDPVSYERAKINYFTLKDGQEWLIGEKQRIAKQTIDPVLAKYTQQFQALKAEVDTSAANASAKQSAKSDEVGDEEDTRYLHKQILSENDKYGVAQRLSEIGLPTAMGYSWIPILLDILIAVSILAILYYGFVVGKITNYLQSMYPVANTL